ncbi:hypothetical protein MAH1_32420 [Sessilibacter sp. MAH1]
MRKKLLWSAVLIISFVGIGFLLSLFGGALNPPANAGENLPRINISALEPGGIITQDAGYEGWWNVRYIIFKNYNSEISVFVVPLREGLVDMPDLRWWRRGPKCKNFGPTIFNGKVVPNSHFKCHDPELNEWLATENVWSLDGTNLGTLTDDMKKVKFKIKGNDILLYI